MRLPSSLCKSPPESQKCSFWVGDPEPGCLPRDSRGWGRWLGVAAPHNRLSANFLCRYYPSGDAFASGSDDATVCFSVIESPFKAERIACFCFLSLFTCKGGRVFYLKQSNKRDQESTRL